MGPREIRLALIACTLDFGYIAMIDHTQAYARLIAHDKGVSVSLWCLPLEFLIAVAATPARYVHP